MEYLYIIVVFIGIRSNDQEQDGLNCQKINNDNEKHYDIHHAWL